MPQQTPGRKDQSIFLLFKKGYICLGFRIILSSIIYPVMDYPFDAGAIDRGSRNDLRGQ
jgi:hypothetical protein